MNPYEPQHRLALPEHYTFLKRAVTYKAYNGEFRYAFGQNRGHKCSEGYNTDGSVNIYVKCTVRIGVRSFNAGRAAWFLVFGELPDKVYYRNGRPDDVWIENLTLDHMEATHLRDKE